MLRAQPAGVKKAGFFLYLRARHGVITGKFPSQITVHDSANHWASATCQALCVISFSSSNNPPYDDSHFTDQETEARRSSGVCWGEEVS